MRTPHDSISTHLPPLSRSAFDDAGMDAFSFDEMDASLASWAKILATDDAAWMEMEPEYEAEFQRLAGACCAEETAHDDRHTFASASLSVMTRDDHAPDTRKKPKKRGCRFS